MLNKGQQKTLDYLTEGKNVFVTGDGGTGKSYVIQKYIDWCIEKKKNLIICAPSGIAALNVGGVTAHRAFSLPIGIVENFDKLKVPKEIRTADVCIIDEISMNRMDVFKEISYIWKKAGNSDKQMIVVGDFFQLPPIVGTNEKETYHELYKNCIYPFECPEWKEYNFKYCILTEIERQKNDVEFIKNLNKARVGDRTCIEYFNRFVRTSPKETDIISLCPTNREAEEINSSRLANLPGPSTLFHAKIEGEVKLSDMVTSELLELKAGARIMTLVNDLNGDFANGSFGIIKKVYEDSIDVKMDNGKSLHIDPFRWSITKYAQNEATLEQVEIGSFEQLPVKLAYAITIHKSQGQTYDAAVISPKVFNEGQLYVALSRIRSSAGLYIKEKISPRALNASKKAYAFYQSIKNDIADVYKEEESTSLNFSAKMLSKIESKLPVYIFSKEDVEIGQVFPVKEDFAFEDCRLYYKQYCEKKHKNPPVDWKMASDMPESFVRYQVKVSGKTIMSREEVLVKYNCTIDQDKIYLLELQLCGVRRLDNIAI